MPELPGLEYIRDALADALLGQTILEWKAKQSIVIRNFTGRKLEEQLPRSSDPGLASLTRRSSVLSQIAPTGMNLMRTTNYTKRTNIKII